MNQISTYQFFPRDLIYLLLIGQLWANAVSHGCWMQGSESALIELYSSDDNESEEVDQKKEKDDNVQSEFYSINYDISKSIVQVFHLEDLLSLYDPEITTPPPEFFLFLS